MFDASAASSPPLKWSTIPVTWCLLFFTGVTASSVTGRVAPTVLVLTPAFRMETVVVDGLEMMTPLPGRTGRPPRSGSRRGHRRS